MTVVIPAGRRRLITNLYPSYFKLQMRWLRSLTPVTYLCTLLGIRSLAAFLQLELFRVYTFCSAQLE
jgi:hypothetical protein